MIKQSRRFIPFRYWDYKYNPITGFNIMGERQPEPKVEEVNNQETTEA